MSLLLLFSGSGPQTHEVFAGIGAIGVASGSRAASGAVLASAGVVGRPEGPVRRDGLAVASVGAVGVAAGSPSHSGAGVASAGIVGLATSSRNASGVVLGSVGVVVLITYERSPEPKVKRRGLLGCAQQTSVFITERGGGVRLAEIPHSGLTYGRVLDDTSEASLEVGIAAALRSDCCSILSDLEPWQHELSIYRDDTEVWCGPVVSVDYTRDSVSIQARDLFAWMDRRRIEQDRFFFETDLSVIFRTYVEDALSRDPSPNIQLKVSACLVDGTRENIGGTSRQAGDELRELARSGLDFTMVGRIMYVARDLTLDSTFGAFTDEAFDDLTISKNGLDAATEFTMFGDPGDDPDDPVRGTWGDIDPLSGLVQLTDTDQEILDFGSAELAARGRVELLNPVPRSLDATFSPNAPVDFNDLRPGIRIPVAAQAGCAEVLEEMRLQSVSVTVGETGMETVTGDLEPVGAVWIGS